MVTGRWFFQGWADLTRLALVGAFAYLALVTMVRISGKRTLAKLNAFDLVVTVALGSTLATVLLSNDVSLAEGVAALALLIALQFAVAWSVRRWKTFERIVKAEPKLLVLRGEFLQAAMRSERITENEIHSAVRSQGYGALSKVEAVVFETDGTVSVITAAGDRTSLAPVESPDGQ